MARENGWGAPRIVFNRVQPHRLLADYVRYYHEDRCHLTLGKDTPAGQVS